VLFVDGSLDGDVRGCSVYVDIVRRVGAGGGVSLVVSRDYRSARMTQRFNDVKPLNVNCIVGYGHVMRMKKSSLNLSAIIINMAVSR